MALDWPSPNEHLVLVHEAVVQPATVIAPLRKTVMKRRGKQVTIEYDGCVKRCIPSPRLAK